MDLFFQQKITLHWKKIISNWFSAWIKLQICCLNFSAILSHLRVKYIWRIGENILTLLSKASMDLMVCQKSRRRWWASSTLVALCYTYSFLWSFTQATRISVQRNEWIPFHDNPSDNLSLIRKLDESRSTFFYFARNFANCTFWENVIDASTFLCCFIEVRYRYELSQFSFEMNCDLISFHLFTGDKCSLFYSAFKINARLLWLVRFRCSFLSSEMIQRDCSYYICKNSMENKRRPIAAML